MAQSTLFDDELSAFFAEHDLRQTLVLTPNKRLSRFLLERHAALSGETVLETPRCFSVQAWLLQQWEEAMFTEHAQRCPMSAVQEQLLWQKVLSEHAQTPTLLNISATAKAAQDAWRLIHEWRLDRNELSAQCAFQPDLRLFLAWVEVFEARCAEHALITAAEIPSQLIQIGLASPSTIALYGFDELTPVLQQLLDLAQSSGAELIQLECRHQNAELKRHEFKDSKQELAAAAAWARFEYERNPSQKIGIVVPELNRDRAKVEAIFQREFEPLHLMPGEPRHATGFNMSAGESLQSLPLCAAAVDILSLDATSIELELCSRLINSPFISSLEELPQRAELDVRLRDTGESKLRFTQIKKMAAEFDEEEQDYACPEFYQDLQNFERLRAKRLKRAEPSQWLQYFSALWQSMGWPGQRNLDTLEYQQLRSFHDALDQFAALDSSGSQLTFNEALEALRLCLSQSSFQAQTRSSPVQILGLLEAAGLPFDKLWLTGLDDEHWPSAPKPNALLPIRLQVELNLPQCSAERERLFAKRLTQRLSQSAAQVVFSSAVSEGDKQLGPSALIKKIALYQFDAQPVSSLEATLFATQKIEAAADHVGPKVVDVSSIRGGARILQAQAACPFQAFARHRLHSSEIPRPSLGLSAAERGILIHRVLELVWRKLKNQAELLALSEADLDQLLDACIEQSLLVIAKKRMAGKRFVQLERDRLYALVRAWLELEKQREPFSVLFNEGKKTLRLSKLPIQLRFDRVDELANGERVVIDYKTGNVGIKSWEGERPDEPQVPLYAIANQEKVSAVAFGQINDKEIAIKGIAEDADIAPGLTAVEQLSRIDLPRQWQGVLAHWRSVLEQLAREFMAGSAAVAPKQKQQTCRYCELHSLCRIRELFELEDESQDDEEEADNE